MEKSDIQEYLRRLQKLDQEISEDDDLNNEFIVELNKVLNGLTQDLQFDVAKKSIGAKLKYINTSNNPDPTFAHEGDSGFDLRAFIDTPIKIRQWEIKVIPTGIYVEVEKGLEVQVRTRSGTATIGVMVMNTPGTVDSHYRGEIKVILANFGEAPFIVEPGDRIAQGVVCPVYGEGKLEMIKVEKLSETKRNDQGFGSTGKT